MTAPTPPEGPAAGPPPVPADGAVDGPPPTPWERQRARVRRRALIGATLGLVAMVGAATAILWNLGDEGDRAAEEALPVDPDARPGPDGPDEQREPRDLDDLDIPEVGADDVIELVDPEDHEGVTREQLRLLVDIDASERAMIGFQSGLADAFLDADQTVERIEQSAAATQETLGELRLRLQRTQSDPAAAETRDRYVVHLDAWVAWLEYIEANPLSILSENPRFTVPVNATGDAFVRALEVMLADDVHRDVRRIGEAIVARGFPGPEQSQA